MDASGKFQFNPYWSVSGSIRAATDRTFLRRYDISRDDRLRSTISAERIGYNSYFSLAGWAVQTLRPDRSEEHTSELQSLMRISYAVFCLKKNKNTYTHNLPYLQRKYIHITHTSHC